MSLQLLKSQPFVLAYQNDLDAWVPEFWAMESVAILEENMVVARLVHRDFQNLLAQAGDIVNTRKPGEFSSLRKDVGDEITLQDSTATNISVPLNQHFHTSFIIKDGEESKSRQSLVDEYISPAMLANARALDQALLGFMNKSFLEAGNVAGRLNELAGSGASPNAKDFILESRKVMNVNKAHPEDRNMVVTPNSETELLLLDLFTSAERVGDEGTALREASLGRKLGYNFWMAQNTPSVGPKATMLTTTGTADVAVSQGDTGYTAITLVGLEMTAGEYFTVAGDDQANVVVSATVGAGDTTAVVAEKANRFPTVSGAVLVAYDKILVDNVAGYPAAHSKFVHVDGFTTADEAPQVGQLISFSVGATRHSYTVISTANNTGTEIDLLLDRPLDLAVVNDQDTFPGPAGEFNLGFHRNSVALVVRPLAPPRAGSGALSAIAEHNGVAMRATMQYDIKAQGTIVTLDFLSGFALLDSNLGVVMYG